MTRPFQPLLNLENLKSKTIILQRVCFFLFLLLCLVHFFSPRSLWLDEQLVFDNIQAKNTQDLLGPMTSFQAFPRVYLILIKLFSKNFDYSVYSLRYFSFVFMLMAYWVWVRIFSIVFKEDRPKILAVMAFSFSHYLIYYASELKPYSMDVLTAGIFTYVFLRQKDWLSQKISRPKILLVMALPLLVFFSYGGVFFFGLLSYNLFFMALKNKRYWLLFILNFFMSLFVVGVVGYFELRNSSSVSGLNQYWQSYFICRDSVGCFFETFWEGMQRLATFWVGRDDFFKKASSFLIPFWFYGIVKYGLLHLFKNRRGIVSIEAIAGIVFLILFSLGVMGKYPFTGERITLFMVPFIICLIIKSMEDLKRVKTLHCLFEASFVILFIFSYFYSFYYFSKFYFM